MYLRQSQNSMPETTSPIVTGIEHPETTAPRHRGQEAAGNNGSLEL